jgi:methyltransferase (TIGR00027 family)
MKNPIAITALLVAAMRAEESTRADRLFDDPFAARLAGDAGRTALERYHAAVGPSIPIIEVRTRYYDEALARVQANGTRQFVIVAAGMDARAFRLPWTSGTRVFELDQPEVIAAKSEALAAATPQCDRRAIPVNLAASFYDTLESSGFDRNARTAWLVEGLLQYLEAMSIDRLFDQIDRLSISGSTLLYDVVGESLLRAPPLAATLQYMKELGAPWIFGSDDPTSLVAARGWNAVVTDPSVIGNEWARWPFPAAPPHVPGIPRGYLIEAQKR